MKLWLDDLRPAPPGWAHVKTAGEAINALQTGTVEKIALDHDLGDPDINGTGYLVVCWMKENNIWPEWVRVHSMNPTGAARMNQVIFEHLHEKRRK